MVEIRIANESERSEFMKMREQYFRELDFRDATEEVDKASQFIVALDDNGKLVGGLRLQTIEAGAFGTLSSTMRQIYHYTDYLYYDRAVENIGRAEIDHILVSPEHRRSTTGGDIGDAISTQLISMALEICKSKDTEFAIVLPTEQQKTPVEKALKSASNMNGVESFDFSDVYGAIPLMTSDPDNKDFIKLPLITSFNDELSLKISDLKDNVVRWQTLVSSKSMSYKPIEEEIDIFIFDWDKVFVDPVPGYVDAYSHAYREMANMGRPVRRNNVGDSKFANIDSYLEGVFSQEGRDPEKIKADVALAQKIAIERYETQYLDMTHIYKDSAQTLSLIRELGAEAAINSNNWTWVVSSQYKVFYEKECGPMNVRGSSRKPDDVEFLKNISRLEQYIDNTGKDKINIAIVGDTMDTDVLGAYELIKTVEWIKKNIPDNKEEYKEFMKISDRIPEQAFDKSFEQMQKFKKIGTVTAVLFGPRDLSQIKDLEERIRDKFGEEKLDPNFRLSYAPSHKDLQAQIKAALGKERQV